MGVFFFIKNRRRRKLLALHPLSDAAWKRVWKEHPILHRLPGEAALRLRDLARVFSLEKDFIPLSGVTLDENMILSISVQSVLPVLELGLDWIDDFTTIYVFPRPYKDLHREMIGPAVHEYLDELGGELTEFGAIILSWEDVEASGWGDGYNVVIHEIAHKLDSSNQAMDGCPFLGNGQDPARWQTVFRTAFEDLKKRTRRSPPLDPYAAEAPEEFFAVASEEFFERPGRLKKNYPDVYAELVLFFRQDPAR